MERTNLKLFRVKHKLSQEEMAKEIGCSRGCYAGIECGKRTGRKEFWIKLQKAFDVPDSDLWGLMKTDEE